MQGYLITAGPLSTIVSSLGVRSWLLLLDQVADEVPCQRLDVHPGYLREGLRGLDDAGQHVPRVGVHGDSEAGEGRDGVEEGAPVDEGALLEGPVEELVQPRRLHAVAARLLRFRGFYDSVQ